MINDTKYDFEYYWINLKKDKNGWYWPSGKKADEYWRDGQPDGKSGDDACAGIFGIFTVFQDTLGHSALMNFIFTHG